MTNAPATVQFRVAFEDMLNLNVVKSPRSTRPFDVIFSMTTTETPAGLTRLIESKTEPSFRLRPGTGGEEAGETDMLRAALLSLGLHPVRANIERQLGAEKANILVNSTSQLAERHGLRPVGAARVKTPAPV